MTRTTRSQKIRPTRLHTFNADRTRAYLREGNIDWVCVKTARGWMRTEDYIYRAYSKTLERWVTIPQD